MLTNSSGTDWFISWFDTTYYQMLYRDRDDREAERFLNNLLTFLKPSGDSSILDLACGRGRHSIFLNAKGYSVTGIDASVNSIAMASATSKPNLHFAVHDMRALFATAKFDYVFNLFTSFGYFDDPDDDRRVLKAVHEALTPSGIFVFDFFNAQKVASSLISKETKEVDRLIFEIERKITDGFVVKTIRFQDQGRAFEFHEKVRLIGEQEMLKYLAEADFEVFAQFGDYQLKSFDANTSDRLIFIAKKR